MPASCVSQEHFLERGYAWLVRNSVLLVILGFVRVRWRRCAVPSYFGYLRTTFQGIHLLTKDDNASLSLVMPIIDGAKKWECSTPDF